jgi:hypothetical protein
MATRSWLDEAFLKSKTQVANDGVDLPLRRRINLIGGISAADNAVLDSTDVTITSSYLPDLPATPLIHYPLNNTASPGATLVNTGSGGTTYDLAITNPSSVQWGAPSNLGPCISMLNQPTGVPAIIKSAGLVALPSMAAFTFEFVYRLTTLNSLKKQIIMLPNIDINFSTTSVPAFSLTTSSGTSSIPDTAGTFGALLHPSATRLTHFLCDWDGSTMRLFNDGRQVTSVARAGTFLNATTATIRLLGFSDGTTHTGEGLRFAFYTEMIPDTLEYCRTMAKSINGWT